MNADKDKTDQDPQTYAIIGAAMEVHRVLGPGFSETVYQEALAIEFQLRSIPFVRELRMPIDYKGNQLATIFRADYLCYQDIVVEMKALARLADGDVSQLINELRASKKARGLLLNFGAPRLEYRRLAWDSDLHKDPSA